MTRGEALRLYQRHLRELSAREPNVRRHAAAIAFRKCVMSVIEETNASEQRAAKFLVRLGLQDTRISDRAFAEKMWFATRHTRHIPQ